MTIRQGISSQLSRLTPTVLAIYIPAWIVLLSALFACHRYDIKFGDLSRDSLAVCRDAGDVQYYYGALSNVGVLVWCAAASISLFTSLLLAARRDDSGCRYFACFGLLSLMLLLDDVFLLHEKVLPENFGISEKAMFLLYLSFALFLVLSCVREILRTDFLLLAIGFTFLGLSMLEDHCLIVPPKYLFQGEPHIFEDGCKFLGITTWCGYVVHSAFYRLRYSGNDV